MTTNLLKRLESSVEAFRLTLLSLQGNLTGTLGAIARFEASGSKVEVQDYTASIDDIDADDDDLEGLGEFTVGKKIQVDLADMDLGSWKQDLEGDLALIDTLLASMDLIGPQDDTKLQHLALAVATDRLRETAEPDLLGKVVARDCVPLAVELSPRRESQGKSASGL